MSKEAMELALEKIAGALPAYIDGVASRKYLATIHKALVEQPAPVQQCEHRTLIGDGDTANDMCEKCGEYVNRKPAPVQQEPVVTKNGEGMLLHSSWGGLPDGTKLYTSPQPAQRTWVGLTDADLAGCDEFEYKSACYWEAKLKEKNA